MLTVYSKPNCPHCNNAMAYLDSLDIDYKKIDITEDKEALMFLKSQNHKTVPQIYLKDKIFVEGGSHGLHNLLVEDIFKKISNS